MRDRIGYDNQTGARGVCEGFRIVKKGRVSILGESFGGVCLLGRDGQHVRIRVTSAWALTYIVSDAVTYETIGEINWIKTPRAAQAGQEQKGEGK